MKVCVVGWYGTETIGDRAILAGIFALLAESLGDYSVALGSLNPFFSKRTLVEDAPFWSEITGKELAVDLFDSTRARALKTAIREADLLVIGGGPLMDLREMHMLSYAVRYARRKKVKVAVLGCGVGPLKKKAYLKAATEVLTLADLVVLRDSLSATAAKEIAPGCKDPIVAVDPAAYCAMLFQGKSQNPVVKKRIVINLRSITREYAGCPDGKAFEDFAVAMVEGLLTEYADYKILLVPHHYFFFGGDDRVLLNTIRNRIARPEVAVQNKALSLKDTLRVYAQSEACIGMRFHAVVLMSLLNGRCRLINYTGANAGKTKGFLNDFDPEGYFNTARTLTLGADALDQEIFSRLFEETRYEAPSELLEQSVAKYREALGQLF